MNGNGKDVESVPRDPRGVVVDGRVAVLFVWLKRDRSWVMGGWDDILSGGLYAGCLVGQRVRHLGVKGRLI